MHAMESDGTPTHNASFARIAIPRSVKNGRSPSGDTAIGRHGKKYRVLSIGARSAGCPAIQR